MKKIYLLCCSFFILYANELITPIPMLVLHDAKKASLGKKLFFDTKLSQNDTISCASCHILEEGGDDNLQFSFGIQGKLGTRNAPTVLNSVFNSVQFWDGSAKNLEEQAKGPIHNPVEMNSNFDEIIPKLKKEILYTKSFNAIYKDGITGKNIVNAIAEYEKTLITPNSRFDLFLKGDDNILTNEEKNGYKLFQDYGCVACHNGVNLGGNLMQKMGVMEEYTTDDFGLFNTTQEEEDKFYFKVPTLRNIGQTDPYFHNGDTKTLKEAVNKMAYYQVGYVFSPEETNDIIDFLHTLTGKLGNGK